MRRLFGRMGIVRPFWGAALCVLSLPAVALAEEGWDWRIAPYLWGSSLSGTVGGVPNLPPAEVELSFGDILDNLDFAGMLAAHGRNGRWAVSGDLQYVKLGAGNPTPGGGFGAVNAKIRETIISGTVDYQVTAGPGYEMWLSGGARYWRVDTQIEATPGILPGRSGEIGDSWVDPMVGLRGTRDIGERSFATGWAYLGGFGAGSDLMADLFGGVGFRFTDTTSGVLGYRYLSVDRSDGDFVYDVEQQGVMAGLVFDF